MLISVLQWRDSKTVNQNLPMSTVQAEDSGMIFCRPLPVPLVHGSLTCPEMNSRMVKGS
jgi:hypothetical protein